MFEAFGDHTKCQGLHAGNRFVAVNAIAHDASQGCHLSQPAAVVFAFDLDRKNHGRTVPSGPAVQQASGISRPDLTGISAKRPTLQSAAETDGPENANTVPERPEMR